MALATRFTLCALASVSLLSAAEAPSVWAQSPPPNVVFLAGDDWGWVYYGFIQRYLKAKIAGVCAGGDNVGQPCTVNGDCPASVCDSELVGDDPIQPGKEYTDRELIFPNFPVAGHPPVDALLTPALDFLAATGNFWPIAHNSASMSQPAFAVTMTGLFPGDFVLTSQIPARTTSPVLPEWFPATYLTMIGGKWQYAESHVTADLQHRAPWDREMASGGNAGEGGRAVLRPYAVGDPQQQALQNLALQRIKEFIACARCSDPSKCLQPTSADAHPDSARLAPRAAPGACQPQPFFVQFSPFIPHNPPRFETYCPYYPRDAAQCSVEPWKSHSVYCTHPSGFDWSCANYSAALDAALRPPGVLGGLSIGTVTYLKHVNVFDRAVDEFLVHLKCPAGGTPDCGEDILANTVLVHRGDHGFRLRGSKGGSSEHSYRTPMILWDPRPGNRLPSSTEGCGGQEGCRNDFAHAVDVLATLRDLSGSTFACDDSCNPCDASCPNACPCDRPDGESRYSEGRSLRNPIQRPCGNADASYTQCLFGRQEKGQGIGNVEKGWYVVAGIVDTGVTPNRTHLCKLSVTCGKPRRAFDLTSDPNERVNLTLAKYNPSFCGDRHGALIDVLRDAISARGWYDACFETGLP